MGKAIEACVHQERAPLGDIEIETCSECGGGVSIITSIEDQAVIQEIPVHLDDNAISARRTLDRQIITPTCRAFKQSVNAGDLLAQPHQQLQQRLRYCTWPRITPEGTTVLCTLR